MKTTLIVSFFVIGLTFYGIQFVSGQNDGIDFDYVYIPDGNFIQITGTLEGDVEKEGIEFEIEDKNGERVKIGTTNADLSGNINVKFSLPYDVNLAGYKIRGKDQSGIQITITKTFRGIIPNIDSSVLESFKIKCETENLENINCEGLTFSDIESVFGQFNMEDFQKRVEDFQKRDGGCLIATATYGSELSLQVQQLREIRDNILLETESGSTFMNGFNQFYYSFSPTVADWERENPMFKETVKIAITPLLTSLSILNYVDIDSEAEVLGYGISLILLNVGMYFVIPALVVIRIFKPNWV